ncbi:hypothetical protein ACEYYB_10375 [Paracoccus sp. p4-l81]|uniref:hypothetical protein n=1 Tax=Paracoccus sp. p4-l81 TaxID=3342806 RepID=UPI0035B9C694
MTYQVDCKLEFGPLRCTPREIFLVLLADPAYRLTYVIGVLFYWLLVGRVFYLLWPDRRSAEISLAGRRVKLLPDVDDNDAVAVILALAAYLIIILPIPVLVVAAIPQGWALHALLWLSTNLFWVVLLALFVGLGLSLMMARWRYGWIMGAICLLASFVVFMLG